MRLYILDSTLREGVQGEGVTLTLKDRLNILTALDDLGIAYIEAGNPASNKKDAELFEMLKSAPTKNSKLCVFGSTRRKHTDVACDETMKTMVDSGADTAVVFGKSSPLHVEHVLGTAKSENLAMIRDSVSYLKAHVGEVIYDAEHFFDGYKQDSMYALSTLLCAVKAGADTICLCDTNGGTFPLEIIKIVKKVVSEFPGRIVGIHAHDDCGLAVANSMAAVDAGARHVQGTFTGFGERCGNAPLTTLIPNLQLKLGYECIPEQNMVNLSRTARMISAQANFAVGSHKAYVGRSAFAHKAGMHMDGVAKLSESFEHINPELVGNARRFLMSEISGKTAVFEKIKLIEPSLERHSDKVLGIMNMLKELEYKGYQFEAAEESFELAVRRSLGILPHYFNLEYLKLISEQSHGKHSSAVMLKVRVNDNYEITAAEGDGPVHAIDRAMRRALVRFYPELESVYLTDFKVRVLEQSATTAATVRVIIESCDGVKRWSTVGVSDDVIEASYLALRDSLEYKLCTNNDNNLTGEIWKK